MKKCSNCGHNQEVCGEISCHSPEVTPEIAAKVLAGEECPGWKPGLVVLEKYKRNIEEYGLSEGCPPVEECTGLNCVKCVHDYALQKAIEG